MCNARIIVHFKTRKAVRKCYHGFKVHNFFFFFFPQKEQTHVIQCSVQYNVHVVSTENLKNSSMNEVLVVLYKVPVSFSIWKYGSKRVCRILDLMKCSRFYLIGAGWMTTFIQIREKISRQIILRIHHTRLYTLQKFRIEQKRKIFWRRVIWDKWYEFFELTIIHRRQISDVVRSV